MPAVPTAAERPPRGRVPAAPGLGSRGAALLRPTAGRCVPALSWAGRLALASGQPPAHAPLALALRRVLTTPAGGGPEAQRGDDFLIDETICPSYISYILFMKENILRHLHRRQELWRHHSQRGGEV